MLYIGERVGNGSPPEVDVAVDPIDGTRLVARGLPGGIATVALAERGSMYHTHVPYMQKLIVGPEAAQVIDITDTVANNLRRIADAEDRSVEDLTVVVLDSDRQLLERESKRESEVLDIDDLVAGDNVFFAATGITDGELLQGVRFLGDDMCHTQSLVMRSYSGTTRYIEAEHSLAKLRRRRGEAEHAFAGAETVL